MPISHFVGKTIPLRPQLAAFLTANGGQGIEEALFLQQIHYLVTTQEEADNLKYFAEGYWWISMSYPQLRNKHFYFLSERTLKRIVARLTRIQILVAKPIESTKLKQMNWYRISYDTLDKEYATWLEAFDFAADYIPALAEDYSAITGKTDHLKHKTPKRKTRPQNDVRPSGQVGTMDGTDCPDESLVDDSLKKEKESPLPPEGEVVEVSLVDSWEWLKKYKGGKKVWIKAKPSGLDPEHSTRWDRLFYAIAEHVRELADFKTQPEAVRGAQAPQLHSMVGSVFAYLWLDAPHIERFVELYTDSTDAGLPSSLDTFPTHLAKYTTELQAMRESEPLPSEPSPQPVETPDPVNRKSAWQAAREMVNRK